MKGKQWVFLVFLLPILLGTAAGCSGNKGGALSFSVGGAPSELAFWERLVDDFERQSGTKVTIIRQPTDTDQRRQGLLVPLTSGQSDPDVFLMDVAWITQVAASGWLEPLEDILGKMGDHIFFERILNLADRYRGALIGLPVYVDGGVLYYRKDLLSLHGYNTPPETWYEMVRISKKIQSEMRKRIKGFYGFVWQGAQYEGLICTFLEFASSREGGGIELDRGKITLNTPENIGSLNFMREIIHTYAVSPPNTYTEMKEEEVRLLFQRGHALFERNWPYAWALHEKDGSPVKGKTGIAPLPRFEPGQSVSTLGGWHIGISKFSDAKTQARRFVSFILSYEVQKKLLLELGWNPGRKDIYRDPEVLQKLPHLAVLREVFERALPRPAVPYYTQISSVIQKEVNAALAGRVTPEEALREAERESQKIIERYGTR